MAETMSKYVIFFISLGTFFQKNFGRVKTLGDAF